MGRASSPPHARRTKPSVVPSRNAISSLGSRLFMAIGTPVAISHRREGDDPEVAARLDAPEPLPHPVPIRLTAAGTGGRVPLHRAPAAEVPGDRRAPPIVIAEDEPDVPPPRRSRAARLRATPPAGAPRPAARPERGCSLGRAYRTATPLRTAGTTRHPDRRSASSRTNPTNAAHHALPGGMPTAR